MENLLAKHMVVELYTYMEHILKSNLSGQSPTQ